MVYTQLMIQAKTREQLEKEAKILFEMLVKRGFAKEYALKEVYQQTGIRLKLA